MNAEQLAGALRHLNACDAACEWQQGKSLSEAYAQIHRSDWLLWLAAKAGVDRRRVVRACCACARTALKYIPEDEVRPLQAIELAERWTQGTESVTFGQVRKATRDAADAAYAYAYAYAYAAARAAASAARAARAAADAAYAYADAADAAAYAAAAAANADADADADAARAASLAEMVAVTKVHVSLADLRAALRSNT